MKAKVMLLIGAMMVSVIGFAQVEFKNSSSSDVKVSSIDGLNTVEVPGKQTANVSFLTESGGTVTAKIQHYTYQPGAGYIWIDDGTMTFVVKNGVATFSNPKQKQAAETEKKVTKNEKKVIKSEKTQITEPKTSSTQQETKKEVSPFVGKTVDFFVKNYCKMTITGYSGILEGLCLETGKASKTKVRSSTGPIQAAIGYDTDPDKTATGANQKWAVLYKSIPEDLDTLRIYNDNLVLVNTGVQITKKFNNRTNIGYLITNSNKKNATAAPVTAQKTTGETVAAKTKSGGAAEDKTIAPNSSRKMKFYLGWNVVTLQYLDENGRPRQAVLLFMITKDQKTVNLTKKSGVGNSISENDLKIE